jgi:ADP-ribose pyrophosphatase
MDMDISDHEILGSEPVFDGRVIKVFLDEVRLPDGRKATWERVAHPGAVGIVPLMTDGSVVMVRQYRHAVRGVLLEIPAGKLDTGEPPLATAQRELAEEAGLKAGEMIKLSEFYNSPGYSDECFHIYLARDLSEEQGESEPDEFLEVERVSLAGALEMVSSGDIRDAKSIIGLSLAFLFMSGDAKPFGGMRTHEP